MPGKPNRTNPIILALAFGALAMVCAQAQPIQARNAKITAKERPVDVEIFKAPGTAKRPAVLVLHGASGFGKRLPNFQHYASLLANEGFDAYLVNYYSAADLKVLASGNSPFEQRFTAWAMLVDDVADSIVKQSDSNGHIGLIGFSNGGILAVGAGSIDTHIDGAVVYYGAPPSALRAEIKRVPPLLILHGDADKIIPVVAAHELADNARGAGASVDLVIYPGESHGFGTDMSQANSADAYKRTLAFLKSKLLTN